jgi:hypothetical protein
VVGAGFVVGITGDEGTGVTGGSDVDAGAAGGLDDGDAGVAGLGAGVVTWFTVWATGATTVAAVLVAWLVGEEPGAGSEVAASACWAHQALKMKAVTANANSIMTIR